MHDRRSVVLDFPHQVLGGLALLMPAERPDHPPMPALKITLPHAAALRFQESFLPLAERAQVRVAGDDNFFRFGQLFARTRRNHLANLSAVSGGVGFRQGRLEAGILKKLLRRTGDDETAVGVIGFRFTGPVGPFTVFVEVIFPNQFVGVGKCVLLENEVARTQPRGPRSRAPGEQETRQKDRPPP